MDFIANDSAPSGSLTWLRTCNAPYRSTWHINTKRCGRVAVCLVSCQTSHQSGSARRHSRHHRRRRPPLRAAARRPGPTLRRAGTPCIRPAAKHRVPGPLDSETGASPPPGDDRSRHHRRAPADTNYRRTPADTTRHPCQDRFSSGQIFGPLIFFVKIRFSINRAR